MTFFEMLTEFGLDWERGLTAFVRVGTGVGGHVSVFICNVGTEEMFFAK